MVRTFTKRGVSVPLIVFLLLGLTGIGCKSLSNTEKGAAAGAGGGAVLGGIVGKIAGNTAAGAIVGAVVGGTAGAIIGQRMDKQAKELEEELDNAEITRVGEAIHINFDNAILFDTDSAELKPEAKENLLKLAENMQQYPENELMIVGHTDNVGSAQYNQGLSERRAQAAASYLMEHGLPPSHITSIGKGLTEPITSNDTVEGRAQNRRAEVVIYASEEYREQLQQQNG